MRKSAAAVTMTLVLAPLDVWGGGPFDVAFKNMDPGSLAKVLQNTQGLPSQSVLEIKGKINPGTTSYYSVVPDVTAADVSPVIMEFFTNINSSMSQQEQTALINMDPQLPDTIWGFGVRPQLKQSESQGYSIYIFMNTVAHPKFLESFKKLTQAKFVMTTLKVRYTQNGPEHTLNAQSPATGSQVTKPLGSFQPK